MNTLKDNDVSPRLNLEEGKMLAGGRNEFFRYIKKESVGETYKYLNQLIKGKSIDKLVDVNELVSGGEELPLFEESLRLIIIDGLHLEKKVVEILLNQNNYEVKRILKCDWFFQSSLSVESYCNLIIPSASLSLKYKLLSKLSKTLTKESDAEKICDFVCSTYRNQLGELLMPKCSSEYILNYYSDGKTWAVNFVQNSRNLLKISRRHPEVGIRILTTLFNDCQDCNSGLCNYTKVINFLASNHSTIFIPFLVKYQSELYFIRFGKHLSRRLGLQMKEIILASDRLSMIEKFKEKIFFKALSYGDKIRYIMAKVRSQSHGDTLKLSDWSLASQYVTYLLNCVKQCDRLPMIQATFKQLYNLNYEDHTKVWNPGILELLPSDQRILYVQKYEKWIEEPDEMEDPHFLKPTDPVSYVYLLDFNEAFGKLKKLHSRAPEFSERRRIFYYMVKSCSINNDPTNLEKLLEYIAVRSRNDRSDIIYEFLSNVCTEFPSSAMTAMTIEKIEELAYYCTFKEDSYLFHGIIEKCILYRLEKDLKVEKQVQWIFDIVILKSYYPIVFLENCGTKHSRALFLKYYELVINWMVVNPEEEKSKEMLPLSILETLFNFNRWNKYDPIRVGDLKGFAPEVKKLIKRKTGETEIEDELINLLDKYLARVWEPEHKMKFFMHTLKRNSDWIRNKWNKVLEYLFSDFGDHQRKFFLSFLKFISFLGKTTEVKNAILKEFENGSSECYKRVNALNMYSRMVNWEEFEKAIELYKPKSEKVDLDKDRNFIDIQFAVPRVMRNVVPSWKCLPLMIKFFIGDFLKMIMPSFYPCSYSTRIDVAMRTLGGYLDDIEHDKRISIRKDVIRIIGEISNRRELLVLYSKWWDEINHYSIRSILLKFVSKCFVEVPTRETFKIVEKFIEESDDLVIQWKPDIGRVPDSFLNDYVLALWRFSERQKASFRNDFQNSILRYFNHYNIRFLSKEFCENIIENNLFKSNSPLEVNDFTINYLISDSETFHLKMCIILDLLRKRMSDTSAVSRFCTSLKTISWSYPSLMFDFFDLLIKNWPNYPTGVMYLEHLILKYFHIYHEARKSVEERSDGDKSKDLVYIEFGRGLKKYYSSIKDRESLVFVLWECLENFINEAKSKISSFDVSTVMNELVTSPTDRSLCIIAIMGAAVDSYDMCKEKKKKICKLIETLRCHEDEVIEIYIEWKFGSKWKCQPEVETDTC